jgi:hypothetical protein
VVELYAAQAAKVQGRGHPIGAMLEEVELTMGVGFADPRKGSELGEFLGYHPSSCCGIRGKLRGGSDQGRFA